MGEEKRILFKATADTNVHLGIRFRTKCSFLLTLNALVVCNHCCVLRADLVPVYSFGENELFPQVLLSDGSVGRKIQTLFKRVMGFAPCLFTGGRWLLLPYRRPVTTVGE